MQDVYVLSIQDVKNQYTVLGKTPTAGTAFVAAEMQKNNGTPLEGIPLANVVLLNAQNQPVPNLVGPYFFDERDQIRARPATRPLGAPAAPARPGARRGR